MGPLATLLTLPVSGPLAGLTWIARQIANAAMQELLDPTRIETALLALERRLEDGKIDEATFEAEEERLLAELAEITALRAAEAEVGDEAETELLPPTVSPEHASVDPTPLAPPAAVTSVAKQGDAGAIGLASPGAGAREPDAREAAAWTLA